LREMLEGDEDEDCGEDDPSVEAYADGYPVHCGWTPPESIGALSTVPLSAHQGWEGPCTRWADGTW
jgi:hypothetical protein